MTGVLAGLDEMSKQYCVKSPNTQHLQVGEESGVIDRPRLLVRKAQFST